MEETSLEGRSRSFPVPGALTGVGEGAGLLAGIRLALSILGMLLLHKGACSHLLVIKHNRATLITGL